MIETEIKQIITLKESLQIWDRIKHENLVLSQRLKNKNEAYARRLENCCDLLKFKRCPNGYLNLSRVRFCRVRGCPICEWRRSNQIATRVYQAAKTITKTNPAHRYVLISLPMLPCSAQNLPDALSQLDLGYRRLSKLKAWIADGCLRFLNISFWNDLVLIKLDCLCLMPSSYFGKKYLSQADWSDLWQQCLRLPAMQEVETKNLNKLAENYVAYKAKNLSQKLDLTLCSENILVDVIDALHKHRLFSACGLFKNFLKCGSAPDKKYSSSEIAQITSMTSVYYAYLPNPQNSDHKEQYLELNELPAGYH